MDSRPALAPLPVHGPDTSDRVLALGLIERGWFGEGVRLGNGSCHGIDFEFLQRLWDRVHSITLLIHSVLGL